MHFARGRMKPKVIEEHISHRLGDAILDNVVDELRRCSSVEMHESRLDYLESYEFQRSVG